jgi:hypothetical protein
MVSRLRLLGPACACLGLPGPAWACLGLLGSSSSSSREPGGRASVRNSSRAGSIWTHAPGAGAGSNIHWRVLVLSSLASQPNGPNDGSHTRPPPPLLPPRRTSSRWAASSPSSSWTARPPLSWRSCWRTGVASTTRRPRWRRWTRTCASCCRTCCSWSRVGGRSGQRSVAQHHCGQQGLEARMQAPGTRRCPSPCSPSLCPTGARFTAREYLYRWPAPLFPSYFEDSLHPFFNNVLRLNTDARVAALHSCFEQLRERVMRPENGKRWARGGKGSRAAGAHAAAAVASGRGWGAVQRGGKQGACCCCCCCCCCAAQAGHACTPAACAGPADPPALELQPPARLTQQPTPHCRQSSSGVITIPASSLTSLTLKYDAMPRGQAAAAAAAGAAAEAAAAAQQQQLGTRDSNGLAAPAASQALLADVRRPPLPRQSCMRSPAAGMRGLPAFCPGPSPRWLLAGALCGSSPVR